MTRAARPTAGRSATSVASDRIRACGLRDARPLQHDGRPFSTARRTPRAVSPSSPACPDLSPGSAGGRTVLVFRRDDRGLLPSDLPIATGPYREYPAPPHPGRSPGDGFQTLRTLSPRGAVADRPASGSHPDRLRIDRGGRRAAVSDHRDGHGTKPRTSASRLSTGDGNDPLDLCPAAGPSRSGQVQPGRRISPTGRWGPPVDRLW